MTADPTRPLPAQMTFPLSAAQRRLWILSQIEGDEAGFNIAAGLHLVGAIDVAALKVALAVVASRHEALRTAIVEIDGEPVQAVSAALAPDLTVVELDGGTDSDAEALIATQASRPFDLASAPLWRALLVKRRPLDAILSVVVHHAIADNRSLEILMDDLAEAYGDIAAGRMPAMTPAPLQYGDYALWQQREAGSEKVTLALRHWRRKLADAPVISSLPTDRPRPERQTSRGTVLVREVPPRLMQRIERLGQSVEATPAMVMLSALAILLHRASGQRSIIVGMPVGGRDLPELEGVVGLFVNMVAVRVDLGADISFLDVLRQVRDSVIDALDHQAAPFERVVEAVNPPRSLAHTPVFQVLFAQIRAVVGRRPFGAASASPYVTASRSSRFDLTLNLIQDQARGWWLELEYNTDLYERARIERAAALIMTLLETATADPAVPASVPSGHAQPDARQARERTLLFRGSTRARSGIDSERYVAPRDDVERQLAGIWGDVLGVPDIGIFDEFFDLGGNSLAAIRIVSRVRKSFAATIPVSTLFTDPTIAYMAATLRGEGRGERSIVHLNGSGRRPPLFAAGSNHRYLELSKALGADQPFYKMDVYRLQELRIAQGLPPHASVEEMAAAFIDDMLTVQPAGPFHIAGQCEGGIVAIEIARQLLAQGHEIGLLLQFDTPVRGYFRKRHWLQRLLVSLARGEVTQKLTDLVRRRHRARISPELEEQQHLVLRDTIWSAIYAYRNDAPYSGRITLLRATQTYGIYDDVATGWDRVAAELEVHDVPGDHIRFFGHSDSQKIVADILRRALANQS